jgi:hypothetical protein
MQEPLPISGRLPAQLKIKYGPAGLLGRFFLWADTAARDRGVTLFFASLKDLVEANRANSDSWRPLFPVFDEALGGVEPGTVFVLIGRDRRGEVVATQAARLYDWPETSLKDEADSLRMLYADPDAAFARGDRCEIITPVAEKITGRVVFSGGVWYRPDFRGKDLATILPRISRAYALTRWNSDFTIGWMALLSRSPSPMDAFPRAETSPWCSQRTPNARRPPGNTSNSTPDRSARPRWSIPPVTCSATRSP